MPDLKRKSIARRLADWITGDRWEARKSIWPYPDGYSVYNPRRNMILESGITKEQAQKICDRENGVTNA